jgi:hypothetical protein
LWNDNSPGMKAGPTGHMKWRGKEGVIFLHGGVKIAVYCLRGCDGEPHETSRAFFTIACDGPESECVFCDEMGW